jgi:hypothetical protein
MGGLDHVIEILGSEKTHCFLQSIVDRSRSLLVIACGTRSRGTHVV